MGVAIGIDAHKRTLAVAVVDELGRILRTREFANHRRGHRALVGWISAHENRRVGIEGSGTYGASLARFLCGAGEDVSEVPAGLTRSEARRRPAQGKSDPVDAVAVARVVAREDFLPSVARAGVHEDLRVLSDYRDQLVRARTQVANRIHKDLVVLCPGYEATIKNLSRGPALKKAVMLVRADRSVRADLVRERVAELRRLDAQLAAVKKRVLTTLAKSGTTLTEIPGIGPFIAARILGDVGDVSRIRSAAAFARMTGTAPLEASSGATTRHRVGRVGNRRLNFALHYMALAQARVDPRASAFIARKRAEGKTHKEAVRCLKRSLANVVYRRLVEDASVGKSAA